MYTREEPDRAHTTVLLKVHDDRFDMDFPVNSIDGEIVPARIFMPCSFAFVFIRHSIRKLKRWSWNGTRLMRCPMNIWIFFNK